MTAYLVRSLRQVAVAAVAVRVQRLQSRPDYRVGRAAVQQTTAQQQQATRQALHLVRVQMVAAVVAVEAVVRQPLAARELMMALVATVAVAQAIRIAVAR
jgi:hypothetical protein